MLECFSFLFFSVTVDLKALNLLLCKEDDEEFELGGKGLDVEFCFLCEAKRVSNIKYI